MNIHKLFTTTQQMNDPLEPMERNPFVWIYFFFRYIVLLFFYFVLNLFWLFGIPQAIEFETITHITQETHESRGMLVVLQGYKASRQKLMAQVCKITSRTNYRVIYIPQLIYDRDKTITASNTDVYSTIDEFCRDHDDEPIHIIGISAGGRFAVWLQSMLRAHKNPMRIITLGSPLNGTALINAFAGMRTITRFVVGSTLAEEFDPLSSTHLPLAECIANSDNTRAFLHFYSTVDWVVFPAHRCTTATGSPKAHVISLRCAHNEIFASAMETDIFWSFLQ